MAEPFSDGRRCIRGTPEPETLLDVLLACCPSSRANEGDDGMSGAGVESGLVLSPIRKLLRFLLNQFPDFDFSFSFSSRSGSLLWGDDTGVKSGPCCIPIVTEGGKGGSGGTGSTLTSIGEANDGTEVDGRGDFSVVDLRCSLLLELFVRAADIEGARRIVLNRRPPKPPGVTGDAFAGGICG